jgi:hypothetical protein
MYTIILDEGVVLRDSDGEQIAPCQDDHDPDFLAYNTWVEAGGQPTILDTRSNS